MSKARTATPSTTPAPRAPRVTRGMRDAFGLNVRSGAGPSESFDAENLSFEFVLATSKPCRSWRYLVTDTDSYPRWTEVEEQLVIAGAEGLDGDDGLVGSSILNSHSYWDVESIVGVIESARLADEGLVCTGRLSRRDGVADIATDIEDGIIRSVSVGFDILEETASLRDGQVPLVTISRWRPREASLVAVPADSAARIRSGAPDVSQPNSKAAPLESRAHGTVPLRAAFWRREIVRDRMDGQVPMLDGEPLGSMAGADAPNVEIGDLIYISGKLWRIRVPLADGGGMVRLQLEVPQPETLTAAGQEVTVHVAGELDDVDVGGTIVVLTLSRLAPGPVEIDRDLWTVVAAAAWGDGGLDRVTLRRD